jgi:hypothetical protein
VKNQKEKRKYEKGDEKCWRKMGRKIENRGKEA